MIGYDLDKSKELICDSIGVSLLRDKQRTYAQVKRKLWKIVSIVKADRDYLIGLEVIIETDCLPIFGMISGGTTPNIAML